MNWLNKIFISGLLVIQSYCITAKPEQIHMAQGKTPNSMVISWIENITNSADVASTPEVIYGLTQQKLDQKAQGQTSSYTFNNYTSGQISHVQLTGLSFSTRYYYQSSLHSFTYDYCTADGDADEQVGLRSGLLGRWLSVW